jgi:hypothetical protein
VAHAVELDGVQAGRALVLSSMSTTPSVTRRSVVGVNESMADGVCRRGSGGEREDSVGGLGVERGGCAGRRRLCVSELTSFNLPAYPMQTASPGHLKTANVIAKSGDRFEARPASRAEHTFCRPLLSDVRLSERLERQQENKQLPNSDSNASLRKTEGPCDRSPLRFVSHIQTCRSYQTIKAIRRWSLTYHPPLPCLCTSIVCEMCLS